MPNLSINEATKARLDKLREETGAGTNSEVLRNALKAYTKELAAEKRAESAEA